MLILCLTLTTFKACCLALWLCVCVCVFNENLLNYVATSVSFLRGGSAYLWAIGVADNSVTFNDVQLGNGIHLMSTVTVLAGPWRERPWCGRSSWCCCWLLCCCNVSCWSIRGFCGLRSWRRVEWWFWWFRRYYLGARLQNRGQWQDSGIFTSALWLLLRALALKTHHH